MRKYIEEMTSNIVESKRGLYMRKIADRKELIEREVGETLRCFDEIETIAGNPFFYTRLQGRLGGLGAQREGMIAMILSGRTLRPALLALLVTLNVVLGICFFQESGSQSESREESLTAFASKYSLYQGGYGY